MTVYYRYVPTYKAPQIPSWITTWPGSDGCSNRVLTLTSTNVSQPPDPGTPQSYQEQDYVTYWKNPGGSGANFSRPPKYRMTDYSVVRRWRREFLTLTKHGTSGVNVFYQWGYVPKVGGNCTPTEIRRACTGPQYSTYDERLGPSAYSVYQTYERSYLDIGGCQPALDDLRNEMVADASQAYDLLTELAELRDIPKTVSQITKDMLDILSALRRGFDKKTLQRAFNIRPIDLLKRPEKALKRLGSTWMNYRYGIMPLVYSYRDIMKLMKRGTEARTYKTKSIEPTLTGNYLPADTTYYKVVDWTGNIRLRGEVYQYFMLDELARLSGVGVNPLVTAWELIPYSFVFDWFISVGTYITGACSTTFAQRKFACLSRRDSYAKVTYVHMPKRDKTYSVSNKTPVNWWGAAPPATPNIVIPNAAEDQPILMEGVDSYSRWVIPVSPVLPTINPSMYWKRWIDGSYLLLNQLGKALRAIQAYRSRRLR